MKHFTSYFTINFVIIEGMKEKVIKKDYQAGKTAWQMRPKSIKNCEQAVIGYLFMFFNG